MENEEKVPVNEIESFVKLKDVNKIYPNGVQAVYDFNIDINPHDFIVLVGPSGCGKSTTLRMIAGLEDISSGYLYIDKVLSNYIASKNRDISIVFQSYALYPQMTVYDNIAFPLRVRKYEHISYAKYHLIDKEINELLKNKESLINSIKESEDKKLNFSSKAVYIATKFKKHEMSTKFLIKYKFNTIEELENLEEKINNDLKELKNKEDEELAKKNISYNENFELLNEKKEVIKYSAKLSEEEIREKVFNAAKILDLGPYLDRRPKELSGGQMQRVALGRAIVRNARIFLMDEPLSNLDAKLRVQMRSEIVRLHEKIGATTIYVTHDQTEAMTMATKIAVMSKGWVQQIDEPQLIYNQPKNIFVATFIGSPAMNIFEGNYNEGKIIFNDGFTIDLGKKYKEIHDKFYQEKIEEVKTFLNTNAVKRMHGLLVYDKLISLLENELQNDDEISKNSEELIGIIKSIDDPRSKDLANKLSNLNSLSKKEYKQFFIDLKVYLLDITDVTTKELAILHNANKYSKDKKETNEEVLFYQRRKKLFKFKGKKNKNLIHVKDNNIVLTNNLYTILTDLLNKYENSLNGKHEVRIGIRPEYLHLDKEYNKEGKSNSFNVSADVVELLGSELLLHSLWNDVDLVSKISTDKLIRPHDEISLCVDTEKIFVFDTCSGDTIADYMLKKE